jgi:hypothetical protein
MLGLVRVDVEDTPDARVLATAVRVAHRRDDGELAVRDLGLSPAAPTQAAWFRDRRPGDRILATAKHLLADGRAIDQPSFEVEARSVRLPPPFPGVLTVQLVGADDWSGLERVVVTLQKRAEDPAATRVFDAAGQMEAINLDMPDPVDRTFRYRMTRTWAGGQVEEDDWVSTDVAVVIVGRVAANVLVVDVTPVGPELPEAGVLLIEVELSYIDPEHQVRNIHTAVIRALADSYRWQVALADPQRRTYRYRVTTHRISGQPVVGSWTTSSDRLLPIPVTRS